MDWTFSFFLTGVLFGVGLAMDAFSVSLANGLSDPAMGKRRMSLIAGTFSFFQILMPLLGWLLVHTIAERFKAFQAFIPWIALFLLLYIGGKMLYEGIRNKGESNESAAIGFGALLVQGIATSIDALSVGFTVSELDLAHATVEALIIGVVTFIVRTIGLVIGKKFGTKLSGKAAILGGIILCAIGIEIFLKGILGG